MADVITRFKLETTQYDSKLRDAAKGLSDFAHQASLAGKDFDKFTKGNVEAVRAFGSISTSANNAKDKVKELVGAYNQAARAYNALTKEQQQSDWAKAMAQSMQQLKVRIKEAKQEMYSLNEATSKAGGINVNSILSELGSQLGINSNLLSMVTSGTIAYTAAIGAAAAGVAYATKQWAAYNNEMARQGQITSVTTGLSGGDADRMTVQARAIARTYGTDFREVINAANTLMAQFGESGETAMDIIRQGMKGMIDGDGQKLLSMIQSYGQSFQAAGISASQLVAIIQNSEGGIFTDENLRSIAMGLGRIRQMSNSTAEALNGVGINGMEMSQQIQDGSITVFQALQKVSKAISEAGGNSKEAGVAMQAVFGRQGVMAGNNLGKAIAELNVNLDETQTQTGRVGENLDRLLDVNIELESIMQQTFESKQWNDMATDIESHLKMTLIGLIELTRECAVGWEAIYDEAKKLVDLVPQGNKWVDFFMDVNEGALKAIYPVAALYEYLHNLGQSQIDGQVHIDGIHTGNEQITKPVKTPPRRTWNKGNGGSNRGGGTTIKTEEQLNNEQIQKLTHEYLKASDERRAAIREEIQGYQKLNEEIRKLKDEALGKVADVDFDKLFPMKSIANGPSLSIGESMAQGIMQEIAQGIQDADVSTLRNLMQVAIKNGLGNIDFGEGITVESLMEKIIGDGADIPDDYWQGLVDQINEKLKELNIEPIQIDFSTGNVKKQAKEMTNDWKSAASAIQSVGSAMTQIEDPAAKVVGTVAQAIATIALSYAQAMSQAAMMGPWAWLAFGATGLSAMIGTISAIHSATGYAEGGIVGGNNFSGDQVGPVMLDSGELVLNRFQQQALAANLQNANGGGMRVVGEIQGEKIVLVANRFLKRSGQGELVMWK